MSLIATFATLLAGQGQAQSAATRSQSEGKQAVADTIQELRDQLTAQQRQIQQLTAALEEQKKAVESLQSSQAAAVSDPSAPALHQPRLGEVASLAPIVPSAPAVTLNPPSALPQAASAEAPASPLQFHLGTATFTPVGFMDMTSVSRSTNAASGIGTNFGGIPYGNTAATNLTETRLSIQNSRIGMRVDAKVHDTNVLGYWESDFLGQVGNPPNGGIAVSSNSYPFRLRLYWADVRWKKFELLGGQSWSMLTPNRKGISPLPGDLFYSQDIDVNYQAGLVWGRIPGFRFVFHPTEKVAFGIALENSEPYAGGGNGGGAITPPTALAGLLGAQVNNGGSVISAAAVHPDIIAKLAFDPSPKFHVELAGVEITNKIVNTAVTPFKTFTNATAGGAVNLNFEVVKNVRFLTNNFWGAGAGRYIFGQAPDFVIRANGALSPVHSGSTVTGIEATVGKAMPTLIYAYYGGIYIQKNTGFDTNGTTRIGYGFTGSGNNNNRTISEYTLGSNTTFWKDGKFGALNLMFQYSYIQRNPWFVAAGAPSDAHFHMGFVNLRYTLPGSAPAVSIPK